VIGFELTDEQKAADERAAAALLLQSRCRKALAQVPDLIAFVRALSVGGQSERGETLPEWTAPMRITAAQDSDEVYAQLVDWVMYWVESLGSMPPAAAVVAWSARNEVQGFKAGTTSEGAYALTKLLTSWLLIRLNDMVEKWTEVEASQLRIDAEKNPDLWKFPVVLEFFEDVAGFVFKLRAKYPIAPRPPKAVSLRPCPVCGEAAVGAEWNSSDVLDVKIACEHCGHVIDGTPAQVAKWLPEARTGSTLSRDCAATRHARCESVTCECGCHFPDHQAAAA